MRPRSSLGNRKALASFNLLDKLIGIQIIRPININDRTRKVIGWTWTLSTQRLPLKSPGILCHCTTDTPFLEDVGQDGLYPTSCGFDGKPQLSSEHGWHIRLRAQQRQTNRRTTCAHRWKWTTTVV